MSVENHTDDPNLPLSHPHVAVDLPPSADGASFSAWQAHLSFACHVTLSLADDATAFHASSNMFLLRQFILLESAASHSHRMSRSGEDVARSEVDLMQICFLLEGEYAGQCGGRPFRVQAGDVFFVDYGQPFSFEASGYRMIALLIPRSAMPAAFAERSLHGFVPDPGRAAVRLFADALRQTYARAHQLTMAEAVAAAEALFDLADGVSLGERERRQPYRPSDLDLFSRAKATIERHLQDDRLSANGLLETLSVSRATLYGLFLSYGGVQAYIRERRLQRCYEIFNSNVRTDETIGAIAFSLGFRNEAHFSRAFKQRFGLSPRHLRLTAAGRGANNTPSTANGVAPDAIQALGR